MASSWSDWTGQLGLHLPDYPDLQGIVVAVLLVIGAWWVGWFLGARLGPRAGATVRRWTGRNEEMATALACGMLRHGTAALILVVVVTSAVLTPYGALIVAVGLGVTTAMLGYRIARAFGLGGPPAGAAAVIILVATTAGALGGMQPLVQSMGSLGFTVGTHRLTLLGLVNFVVVALVLYVVARLAHRILMHSIARTRSLDVSQRALVQKLAGIAVIVVAVMLGIDLLGIDLTAFTVFSGALGLAVGFGLQKTLGNLIAGLILLMDRSVKPGDVIVVGDSFGQVGKIGVRAVSVVTRDGKEHLIPNEKLMTEPVENWSYSSRNVRLHIPVGISYESDLPLAQKLMIEAATSAKRVLAEPKPSVWLRGFGDSSVDHEILVWIADPELGTGSVRSDVLNRLWLSFKEAGIELPFPQQDVHIRSMPGDGEGGGKLAALAGSLPPVSPAD